MVLVLRRHLERHLEARTRSCEAACGGRCRMVVASGSLQGGQRALAIHPLRSKRLRKGCLSPRYFFFSHSFFSLLTYTTQTVERQSSLTRLVRVECSVLLAWVFFDEGRGLPRTVHALVVGVHSLSISLPNKMSQRRATINVTTTRTIFNSTGWCSSSV